MNTVEKSQLHWDGSASEEKPFAMTDVWGLFTVQIFRGFKKRGMFPGCLKELYPHSWEAESRKKVKVGLIKQLKYFLYEGMSCTGTWCFQGSVGGRPTGLTGDAVPLTCG